MKTEDRLAVLQPKTSRMFRSYRMTLRSAKLEFRARNIDLNDAADYDIPDQIKRRQFTRQRTCRLIRSCGSDQKADTALLDEGTVAHHTDNRGSLKRKMAVSSVT